MRLGLGLGSGASWGWARDADRRDGVPRGGEALVRAALAEGEGEAEVEGDRVPPWGDMGRFGEIWADMGRYGEVWGDIGR